MIKRILLFALCLLPATVAVAQMKSPVEGVWKMTLRCWRASGAFH